MTGNEFVKQKRIESHLSIRGFAMSCDIAPRMVSYYEKGEKPLTVIPAAKAFRYFSLLEIDVESFFSSFYPYKEELKIALSLWEREHPWENDIKKLKIKYYNRLAKIKERNKLPKKKCLLLEKEYKRLFIDTLLGQGKEIFIDKAEYEQYILPYNYMLRKSLSVPSDKKTPLAYMIEDALYKTEFSLSDLSGLCSITKHHLNCCVNGMYNINNLKIISILKLCYILDLDFNDVSKCV